MKDDFLKSFPIPSITNDSDDDEVGDGDQYENEDEAKDDDHDNGGLDDGDEDDTICHSVFSLSTQLLCHNRCNYTTNVRSPRRLISVAPILVPLSGCRVW